MASKEFKMPQSFTELLEQGRKETPPCPDFRLQIRQCLAATTQVENEHEMDWIQILIRFASFARVKTGFGIAFAVLMITSYLELKHPEPQSSRPSGPPMLLDQMFSE
ncbi:MAG: hypothetical protein HOH33_08435 [Verrucomicrobia bacterium]|jgi:hypothetical protein|nr:hypothetical protein [Verrucomicrobiota bacterium]